LRIWYDTEFIEDGRTIDLISIGMVREDGAELYLVNEDIREGGPNDGALYEKITRHDFLMKNVVPHLPLRSGDGVKPYDGSANVHGGVGNPFYRLDLDSNLVVPKRYIRNAVRDFVLADQDIPADGSPVAELWAYYGAYDHIVLCQLFGPMMMALPKGFPMWTNDIQQEHERLLREGTHPTGRLPGHTAFQHNALEDARWNRQAWQSLKIA
jgi:hypothetical protein